MIKNMRQELIKLEKGGFLNIYVPVHRLRHLIDKVDAAEELAKGCVKAQEAFEQLHIEAHMCPGLPPEFQPIWEALTVYRKAGGGNE